MDIRFFDFAVGALLALELPEECADWLMTLESNCEWKFFEKSIIERIPDDWPSRKKILEMLRHLRG